MSDNFVEDVKAAIDIVSLISEFIPLKQKGGLFVGKLRTEEKTASCTVYPLTQSWHDFGDGTGGDCFNFIMVIKGCDFATALEFLADKVGISRPTSNGKNPNSNILWNEKRRNVERLLTLATRYYHSVLPAKIRQFLWEHYGFTDKTINDLQIGWADGHLFEHLHEDESFNEIWCFKTGLFVHRKEKDFFQSRIIFPYWKASTVRYFIGRRVDGITDDSDWELAKYKKLPTYDKEKRGYISECIRNDVFFNEDAALGAKNLLVTEGVTDAIAALQAGISCISPVTTKFRNGDHPKLLKLTKNVKRIVLCNDSESSGAGEKGALSTAAALIAEGRDVRIAELPRPDGVDKIDVNEFLRDNPPERFREIIEKAKRLPEYMIDSISSSTSKIELASELVPIIDLINEIDHINPIEAEGYYERILKRFKLSKNVLNKARRRVEQETKPTKIDRGQEHKHGLRGELQQKDTHYFIFQDDGSRKRISTFVIEPVEEVVIEDEHFLIGNMKTMNGPVYKRTNFPKKTFNTKRAFQDKLQGLDTLWTGSDDNAQALLELLMSGGIPRKKGTYNLGYTETPDGPLWVGPDCVIGPDGFKDSPDIVYIAPSTTIFSGIKYENKPVEDVRKLAAEVIPLILEVNSPEVVLPLLGWFYATPLRPRIIEELGHFPICTIWGTQGSGKTSLVIDLFWRLLGVVRREPFSCTETEFPFIKKLSSTDSVPLFFDEFKPRDMKKYDVTRIYRYIRSNYAGEIVQRGRKDQSVVSYKLSAPFIIAGESRPEGDAALAERIIPITLDKNRFKINPGHVIAFNKLKRLPVHHLAASFIQWSLSVDIQEEIDRASRFLDGYLLEVGNEEALPFRVRDNLLVMLVGLHQFSNWAEYLGVKISINPTPALKSLITEIIEGEGAVKDQFDLFLENVYALVLRGRLIEDRDYVISNGLLHLSLKSSYTEYLEAQRRAGLQDETNGIRALRRTAKEKMQRGSYVKELDKRIKIGEGYPRTVVIDLAEVPGSLEVEEFPSRSEANNQNDDHVPNRYN